MIRYSFYVSAYHEWIKEVSCVSMSKIRIIQIGAGGFGQSWLPIVKDYQGAELVAVVDVMPDNLDKAAQITGLSQERLFRQPEDAFREIEADIALIVPPPQTHKALAAQALEGGLHVLMEKPLTHTYEEAVELLDLSRGFNQHIAVSQNYRWRAPVQTVKKLLNEGAVGSVGYVEYAFRKAKKFGGWRDKYSEILLEDMAIHHFDILRFLLDAEADEIMARSFRPSWSWFSGNPSASVTMQMQRGIQVHYFGSWVAWGKETSWNGDIRIVGDQGAIEMINDEVTLWTSDASENAVGRVIEHIPAPLGDRASSLHDFVTAIQQSRTPATPIQDNIRSFELTCAAIQSAKSQMPVRLDDFSLLQKVKP